ncbi:hypothetical protein LZZ85_13020 [Terrimonas sp. NA20]|uniref:Lipoprotein n=1 Tax=Terrimonas ginsenosidimutans TaxID=2908004 RepID=A0ABS9KSC2_9BACT|nr:hypothetical protein [Terrimonas ginsenosidimutans]MCG2615215.1 hypothetical protein [Terrimonas ginsenosidimutans]
MKSLFTRLTLLLAVTLSLTACSKDKDENSTHISVKIDGVVQNFSVNAMAMRMEQPADNVYSIQIAGASANLATASAVTLMIVSNEPLAPGKFGFGDLDDPNFSEKGGMIGFALNGTDAFMSSPDGPNLTEITITSISSNSVQGTFKGNIFGLNPSGTALVEMSMTEGTFNVPIIR